MCIPFFVISILNLDTFKQKSLKLIDSFASNQLTAFYLNSRKKFFIYCWGSFLIVRAPFGAKIYYSTVRNTRSHDRKSNKNGLLFEIVKNG